MTGQAGLGILDSIYSQHAPKCTRNEGYFDGHSRIWTTCEKQSSTHCDGHNVINLYNAAGEETSPVFVYK